ncbi:MAG: thermostable hemolysin [Acinetobacter sp.]
MDVKTLDRRRTLERVRVESFISDKYKEIHNASLSEFFSTLFAGYTENRMQVAIGMENLSGKDAFLEQYLETPVQVSLEKFTQSKVSRDKLVEIGNLASLNMENAKLMVAFLVFHLSRQKVEWAVCTGTVAVRYVLQQMRLHFMSWIKRIQTR